MTHSTEQAVLDTESDAPGPDRVTIALHGLTVLLVPARPRSRR